MDFPALAAGEPSPSARTGPCSSVRTPDRAGTWRVPGEIIGFMATGMLAMPPCAVCGAPSSRVELVAPDELPADWERWDQERRDRFLARRDPGRWYFFYEGPVAGNGSGDHIGLDEAARILQGFTGPCSYDRVHAVGFYDDAGFCEKCKVPYCSRHWRVSVTGYGHCPEGHGKSLDPLY